MMETNPGNEKFSKNKRGSKSSRFRKTLTKLFTVTQTFIALLILIPIILPTVAQQNPTHRTSAETITDSDRHYLIFDKIGNMASSTTYIHAVIPLNISTVAAQAQPLYETFTQLQKLKTQNLTHLPFCKNMYEIGKLFEERLFIQLNALKRIDGILPQDSPTSLHHKTKRVPIPAIFLRILMSTWFSRTVYIAKRVTGVASAATIFGTAAHLVTQSNRQEAAAVKALEEAHKLDVELNDLIKQYVTQNNNRSSLHKIVGPETENLMKDNLLTIQMLNQTLTEAKEVLPPQYSAHFNFEQLVPLPPPKGWENHPTLIQTYTDDLTNANTEIRNQIETLRASPYVTRPPSMRLTRHVTPTSNFDKFMHFFLSLTAWDHPPFEVPSPSEGTVDEFVSVDESLSREPRNALVNWAALASVVSGTFLGLYSTIESGMLRARLNSLEKAHNLLVLLSQKQAQTSQEIVKDLDHFLRTIDLLLIHDAGVLYAQLDRIMIQWELQVRMVIDAVQQAQHQKLSINLLDQEQLLLLQQATLELASKHQYQVLPQQLSDYFQLDVSYARSGPDVLLIVHVPCVSTDQLMTIYKFVPFPFPLPASTSVSQLTIQDSLFPSLSSDRPLPDIPLTNNSTISEALFLDLDSDMIAINREQRYKLLTEADLAGCIKKNHIFLCEKNAVLNTDLGDTCLGALYFRSTEGVKTQCKFEKRPLKETVYQTGPFSFLVFTPEPYTTQVECRNGTHIPLFLGRMTKLNLEPHCYITLKAHHLQPSEHFQLDPSTILSEWIWNPLQLPAHLLPQAPHVDLALNHLSSSIRSLSTDSQALYSKTQSDLKQLTQDATLDSEFEALLVNLSLIHI